MAKQEETYALCTNTTWMSWPNPGAHRATYPNWSTMEQKVTYILYDNNKRMFNSEANVRRAIISALHKAVPRNYKQAGGCDQCKDVQAVHLSSDHPQHLPQQPWKVEPCWKDRTLTQMDQGLENKWAYQRTLWPPWRMIRPRPWEQPWIHARADDWQGTHGRPIHMKICEGRPRMQWIWH